MRALVQEGLAAWREAERVAAERPDGPEHDAAVRSAERLRDLYAELTTEHGYADDDVRSMLESARIRRLPAEN
jgi:hypothetical protein